MVGSRLVFSANPTPGRREYALFRGNDELLCMDFHLAGSASHVVIDRNGRRIRQKLTAQEARRSVQFFLLWAMSQSVIISEEDVDFIGIKVSAPGKYFQETRTFTEAYMNKLFSAQNSSPAHISAVVDDARQILKALPGMKVVAVSDSAFHESAKSMTTYALPKEDVQKLHLDKFGFHGTTAASVVKQLKEVAGKVHARVIICELGSESTVTALHKGKSVYTSSGYSPAGGLPSVHGSGDVDPNTLMTIASKRRYSPMQLQSYLNTNSGLAGFSGTAGSFTKLFELSSESHSASARALKLINESVKQELASAAAMLNGFDMLVITGEDGLSLPKLRKLVLSDMEFLNIHLDLAKNRKSEHREFINQRGKTGIVLVEANELEEIAAQAASYV